MSIPSSENDAAGEIGQFYDYLWGTEQGYVYLPVKDRISDDWKKIMFEWPKHREHAIVHTLAASAEGKDVYVAPVIFNEPRPIKENVKGSNIVWADFDGNAPESWPEEGQKVAETGADGPRVPAPSLRIQSSRKGHEHVYWRLDEFTTSVEFIENTNRAIAYELKADTSGWDVNQVLRPPHTTNYKNNNPVTVVSVVENVYQQGDFKNLRPVKQLVSEALDLQEMPAATWVVAKYTWDEDHYNLFMSPSIEEGKRSHALMKIGHFGAESGMADAEIYALLVNADDRWGKFKNRTDRKRRLLDIINKARQKHPVGLQTPEGLLKSVSPGIEVSTEVKYLYGFQEFLDTEINIEWAFENLLEVGGIGVLSALPGVGKTQMSIQFGTCAALGKPFLKWTPVKKQKVIIFSLEMAHAPFKHFLQQIAKGFSEAEREVLDRNLKIVPLGEPLPFDKPEGRKFIEAIMEEYKPDGIIIDSMGKVTDGSLNDELKIKELNKYYGHLRSKYSTWLWFIHHNRKPNGDNKKPRELGDLYGSQYIGAEVTVVLNLWREKDTGKLELSQIKSRLYKEIEPFEVVRNENLHFAVSTESTQQLAEKLVSHVSNDGEVKGDRSSRAGSDDSLFGF